ncbi:hypothetical protein PanWU01x14_128240 [Parasponia andersonii]|uniref:Uncharacterized protein n=1 Tax=Parasponia andersonii TaxID=3476 RepID=A0A2P5CS38_PARAD|nr:hypothetical protein PanWU01x14_128240 [Parasponia andersonii]
MLRPVIPQASSNQMTLKTTSSKSLVASFTFQSKRCATDPSSHPSLLLVVVHACIICNWRFAISNCRHRISPENAPFLYWNHKFTHSFTSETAAEASAAITLFR